MIEHFATTEDTNAIRIYNLISTALKIVTIKQFSDLALNQLIQSPNITNDQKIAARMVAVNFIQTNGGSESINNLLQFVTYGSWSNLGVQEAQPLTNQQRMDIAILLAEVSRSIINSHITQLNTLVTGNVVSFTV